MKDKMLGPITQGTMKGEINKILNSKILNFECVQTYHEPKWLHAQIRSQECNGAETKHVV